jgi:hypothetical protein
VNDVLDSQSRRAARLELRGLEAHGAAVGLRDDERVLCLAPEHACGAEKKDHGEKQPDSHDVSWSKPDAGSGPSPKLHQAKQIDGRSTRI